jgi:hypothetical protein
MNNTKTTLVIVAVLTAATLVGVGTVAAAAAGNDHMAFAYKKDKNAKYGGDNGIGDGSTVIIKKLKVKEQLSGFFALTLQ